MIRHLFFLLMTCVTAYMAAADKHTIWEGRTSFPMDWSVFQQIEPSIFSNLPYGEELTFYYEDLYAIDESAGYAQIYISNGEWSGIESVTPTADNEQYTYPSGSFTLKLLPDIVNQIFQSGLIIQGANFTLTRVEIITTGEPTKFIHDMIYGENSNFEMESGNWTQWGKGSMEFTSPGYESSNCMLVTTTESGQSWDHQVCYTFEQPLEAGKTYRLQFRAKTDVEGGANATCMLMNRDNFSTAGFGTFTIGNDWALCETDITVLENGEGVNGLLLNFGEKAGAYYVDDIRFGLCNTTEPDKNILYQDLGVNTWNHGYFKTEDVNPGDVLRITFQGELTDQIPSTLTSVKTGAPMPGTMDFFGWDLLFNSLAIDFGVTPGMVDLLKDGAYVSAFGSDVKVKRIEVVRNVFNPNGMIAYGVRSPMKHTVYTDMKASELSTIATISESSPSLDIHIDGSLVTGVKQRTRTDEKVIFKSDLSDDLCRRLEACGNFSFESYGMIYYFYNNPNFDNPVYDSNDHIIWYKATDFKDWNNTIAIPAPIFKNVKGGDYLDIFLDDVCSGSSYATLQLSKVNWAHLNYDLLQLAPKDVSADGYYHWRIPLNEDLATELRQEGLRLGGTGLKVSHIKVNAASGVDPNAIFYGYTDGDITLDISGCSAGDILRFYVSSRYNDCCGFKFENGIKGIPNSTYTSNYYTEIGVTEDLLKSSNGQLKLNSSDFDFGLNLVERIPNGFDPKDVLVYAPANMLMSGTRPYITDDIDEIEVIFTGTGNFRSVYTRDDNYNFIDIEGSISELEDGRSSLIVAITPEIAAQINKTELIIGSDYTFEQIRVLKRSGIQSVTADDISDSEAVYYNLQGIRVENPTNGIYIRKQGNTVTKILVK